MRCRLKRKRGSQDLPAGEEFRHYFGEVSQETLAIYNMAISVDFSFMKTLSGGSNPSNDMLRSDFGRILVPIYLGPAARPGLPNNA